MRGINPKTFRILVWELDCPTSKLELRQCLDRQESAVVINGCWVKGKFHRPTSPLSPGSTGGSEAARAAQPSQKTPSLDTLPTGVCFPQ
jgi:hypothetical protein